MLQIEAIKRFQLADHRRVVQPLLEQAAADPVVIMRLIEEQYRERDTVSFLRVGLDVAARAATLADADNDSRYRDLAVNLADDLLRRYFNPVGSFIEYDRNSWLEPDDLWRTIPWGTGFRGNEMVDVYDLIGEYLPPQSQAWWRDAFERTARWIMGNPIVGSFVFNCALDLCRLLWRIGRRLDNTAWMQWALDAAHERIRRDLDEEGWIQGENGGCSGTYQLVGANFLALFAWESRDPGLIAALERCFDAVTGYATPTLLWAGNFGTRSSHLNRVKSHLLPVMAALGNRVAAHFMQTHGRPDRGRNAEAGAIGLASPSEWPDLALWEAALATPPAAPEYPPLRHFRGIDTIVVRQGPFVASFANYDRAIWARGLINLWHAQHDDMIFATLHALPREVEKSKLHLGDTSDWAGFPHVRVHGDSAAYDSQQHIAQIETAQDDGVSVRWTEPLLDREGNAGGALDSHYRFSGARLDMEIALRDLAGTAQLHFHLLKRPHSFFGNWVGEQVEQIERGELPAHGGLFRDRSFAAGDQRLVAWQIDRAIFVFELLDLPDGATITTGIEQKSGLHTGNLGGFRLRIALPDDRRAARLRLRFRAARSAL